MLRARGRLTLRTAMIGIMACAVILAAFEYEHRPHPTNVSIKITAADQDASAIARAILSPAVLDDALTSPNGGFPPLSALPRFAKVTKPRARLSGLLRCEWDPKSHTVQLSMDDDPDHDAMAILSGIKHSYQKLSGIDDAPVVEMSDFSQKIHRGEFGFLVSIWAGSMVCLLLVLHTVFRKAWNETNRPANAEDESRAGP